jgi:hypothetical protein
LIAFKHQEDLTIFNISLFDTNFAYCYIWHFLKISTYVIKLAKSMILWLFVSCLTSIIIELLMIGVEPLVALLVWGVTILVCVLHLSLKQVWSNIVPHATMANCQAWRIRSSYFSLVWWWSSPKWLPPCPWWCKLE